MTNTTVKIAHPYDYPFLNTIGCKLKMTSVRIIFGATIYIYIYIYMYPLMDVSLEKRLPVPVSRNIQRKITKNLA